MKWVVIAHCEAKNNGKMEQFTREIAKFEYPHQAEEFIEKCLPQERRSSFEVIHRDDTPELKAKQTFELTKGKGKNKTVMEFTVTSEEDVYKLGMFLCYGWSAKERKC